MSKYTCYYYARKSMYRNLAVRWKAWVSGVDLSEEDSRGISLFFKSVAKRFGLVNEFKELGVI